MARDSSNLVVFRGGFSARFDVVERLLELERRGARFVIQPDGRIRVDPSAALDAESRDFLRQHRDEALRVLEYQADDTHLWDDQRRAQPGHVPAAMDDQPAEVPRVAARRSMPRQKPHHSKQDYATPAPFLEAVRQRLGIDAFAVDFAADATNAKAPRFLDVAQDALRTPHWEQLLAPGAWGWLNPPYTDIGPWARKCRETKDAGGQVAFLVPASTGAKWFRDDVHGHAQVLLLNGRLAFMPGKPKEVYPKDCLLALYSPALTPGFESWDWRHAQTSRTTPRNLPFEVS